ncbi:hypothetical protein CJD36_015415 [Flavipsychrobacter stenotrophus]|uniref:Uncharacterized protein n=1 Tax=Flavipsychrobacter stenotrophus TaxID=2077091 RepID=A0A2S7STM6_9BACT|nr:hypothetical protein [Flavipsychrobacter stenotrophus]PQJ10084.1 hypothetical protein CJD36_015415 [Flavipsychrobacter stenotrophus]
MNELINWIILSAILLVASLALAGVGISKKKLNLFITAVAVFILFMVCGGITSYQIIHKSVININKGYDARK